jgi:hypothetical protein
MKYLKFNTIYESIIKSCTNKNKQDDDEEISEDGECGASVACDSSASSAGLTTNSVFGSGDSAFDSIYVDSEKDPDAPGLTTHDLKELYTPSINRKKYKDYPLFKRSYKKVTKKK